MIHKLIHTGVSDENLENVNSKIRLSNLISLFIIVTGLISIPYYFYFRLFFLINMTVFMVFISFLGLFLQSRRKHLTGSALLIFGIILFSDGISLHYGVSSNFHFFLICTCLGSLILFESYKFLRNLAIGLSSASLLLLFLSYLFDLTPLGSMGIIAKKTMVALDFYGYFNFFALFAFALVFFSSFIKQNGIFQGGLLNKNLILEHKNGQITDSIKYAKRIQSALLPSSSTLKENLEESFVLYKPKDIVAGDFYWFEKLEDGSMLFAAADSTGHGVPGALVSVVCTHALNQAVKEFGLTDPGQILDKVRELVVTSFQKSENELKDGMGVKDGMDISLCLIDKNNQIVKWAGANNPLWIIRNNSDEVEVIKPDKQAVAKTEKLVPFTTHTVQFDKGDCFYLFTDGYTDQFGGENAKKFMQKRLKDLLLRIYKKPMSLQRNLIHDNLLTWMGNLEQVDDICFAGIKF